MRRRGPRRVVAVVAVAGAIAGGCAADVVATTGTAAGEAGQAPLSEAGAGATSIPPAVCATEARTLTTAAEAYRAVEGRTPTSVDDLVGGYLDQAPAHHELRAVGDEVEVVPIPGAGCD